MNEELHISTHAVERFVERLRGDLPRKPEKTLRRMLDRAEPDEKMDGGRRLARMLTHGKYDTVYLRTDAWRFVVTDGVVVTVEHTNPTKN